MTKFTTGQVSEQVAHGFLRAEATERALKQATRIQDITFLAGTKYAATTQAGIEKAVAAYK